MVTFFMPVQDFKYYEITEKIIGCGMKVHRYFGPGFPEIVYKRGVMIELDKVPMKYLHEFEKEIFYEGKYIYKRRLDSFVEDKVLVELKARSITDDSDINQIINYLRVFKIEVGQLLNFGSKSLYYKRFVNSNKE